MVMNLDKCIGCHTCTVTCKQVWTNRPGTEYVYFNNVETKPGIGYPKRYEDQEQWHGGWTLDKKGRLQLKAGGRLKKLLSIFYNPDLPTIDDYGDPWTYDYQTVIDAPLGTPQPQRALDLRPHRPRHDREVGQQLRRRPRRRAGDGRARPEPRRARGAGQDGVRAGVHVLPAAHLRALPEPVVRRLLPVRRDVQARGGRHRPGRPGPLPRLAVLRLRLPVQEGLLQPPHRQGGEVHLLLPAHRGRASPRSARRPASGGCATSGLFLYDADKVLDAAATADVQDLYEAQLDVFLDPHDPAGAGRRGATPESRTTGSRQPSARRSTSWRCGTGSRCRCIRSTAPCRWSGTSRRCRRWPTSSTPRATTRTTRTTCSRRSTRCASRSSTSRTCSPPVTPRSIRTVLRKLAAVRAIQRAGQLGLDLDENLPASVGASAEDLDDLYRLLAIAKYEQRYVIPPGPRRGGRPADGPARAAVLQPGHRRRARHGRRRPARHPLVRPTALRRPRRPSRRRRPHPLQPARVGRRATPEPVPVGGGRRERAAYKLASVLLQYPTAALFDGLGTWTPTPQRSRRSRPATGFGASSPGCAQHRPPRWRSTTCETFDLRRRCALYLTYFRYGDTRKRGMAMVVFKTAYRDAGFVPSEDELPDYLPMVLDFAALLRARGAAAARSPRRPRAAAPRAGQGRIAVRRRARRGRARSCPELGRRELEQVRQRLGERAAAARRSAWSRSHRRSTSPVTERRVPGRSR